MFTADQYRAKAAESAESLKRTDDPSEIREFQRSKQSFNDLARNEDWLADNFDKMIRSRDIHAPGDVGGKRLDGNAVAEIEEHIAASGRPSSCNGTPSRRSSSVSFLIPQVRSETCRKRSH